MPWKCKKWDTGVPRPFVAGWWQAGLRLSPSSFRSHRETLSSTTRSLVQPTRQKSSQKSCLTAVSSYNPSLWPLFPILGDLQVVPTHFMLYSFIYSTNMFRAPTTHRFSSKHLENMSENTKISALEMLYFGEWRHNKEKHSKSIVWNIRGWQVLQRKRIGQEKAILPSSL